MRRALRLPPFAFQALLRADDEALDRFYEYYDPIHTLPEEGQKWWAEHGRLDETALKAAEMAEASRRTAALQSY